MELIIDHLNGDDGKNRVAMADTINISNINGSPVKLVDEISFVSQDVTSIPILVYFSIDINAEAKNINTKTFPIESRE